MVNAKAITSISNFVMSQAKTLDERLACILKENGGKFILPHDVSIFEVHSFNGMSGYNYWLNDTLVAQLYIGTLLSGTYVIYKKTFIDNELNESYDYYDSQGNFFYNSPTLDGQCLSYNSIEIDPTCPMINHIYNVLNYEYEGTTFNFGNTGRIQFLESLLKKFYKSDKYLLSVNKGLKDKAITSISNEIIRVENDQVLKWSERQTIFKQLKTKRSKILSTKRRAHNFHYMLYDFIVKLSDIKLKYNTFKQRPLNNFLGSLYKHTLGNFFWFIDTVKSNLGYSVALAIYGPFTFYFITQPMNPHAMWAVGKVRNAYIQVSKSLESAIPENPPKLIAKAEAQSNSSSQEDKVSTTQSASQQAMTELTNHPAKWDTRMGNFKAMQIAYEGNLLFAERIGRIEQFETIYNFPLTAEAAWMEMQLYLNDVEGKLKYMKNLDKNLVGFLENEKKRTIELQYYLWQKMGQFFLDHPYIVVDQDSEQPVRNYYTGRQFIFFKKMTDRLSEVSFIKNYPKTHEKIDKLADKFEDMKIEGNSVLDTLKKNSKLFQQKDLFSSDEHRDYMKRQWEVVYMQQLKKQEASSFSLQAYTWSIRNAMWLLQTIYSAKRSELWKHVNNHNLDNTTAPKISADHEMDEYFGNMFNNLVMEYVSIRKEMIHNLAGDSEGHFRENIINNVKAFLMERDALFKTNIYAQR